MKTIILILLLLTLQSAVIIRRHDIADKEYIKLGKKYDQYLAHFSMGEGTVINNNWILTAAHLGIILKENLDKGLVPQVLINGQYYEIDKVEVHPKYEEPINNDIALVKLKKSLKKFSAVKLYNEKKEKGKNIIVAGRGDYGNGQSGPKKWDKITRAATNKIDGTEDKWIYFRFDGPDSENSTDLEGISGPGDSGGPAFVNKGGQLYLIGVSSHQRGEGKEGTYGAKEYYARVSHYIDWIEGVMRSS